MNKNLKIGIGFDIHRFSRKRKLVLGGVNIAYKMGLYGHSDADVLLHAICDAFLGAMSKPDIGQYFPDTDPRHKNISSRLLLGEVIRIMRRERFSPVNIDCIIIADEPKLAAFTNKIKASISKMIALDKNLIGIKAKTTEGILSFSGKGIAAYCVVLLKEA